MAEQMPGAMPFVHDPSTVIRADGVYYVYSTGRGIPFLSSPDGVNWTRQGSVFPSIPDDVHASVPKNNGTDVWAPDVIHVGGLYYLYYAVSSWGSFNSAVALVTSPALDPKNPAYKWTDRGVVVSSDGKEELNAIDPGVMLAPDGTLWLCYGSYHGTIDLVQLDPKTGLRIRPDSPVTIIATGSEASDIIAHDGYFYLFVNHGSCCQGKNSSYNIRAGRARSVTGPYLDRYGQPLTKAPGNLFLASHDRRIGPGHFGRVIEEGPADGAERFSLHYEADLDNQGRATLGIRPLLWTSDGWPVAGDNLADATYQIVSRRSEDVLEVGQAPKVAAAANAVAPNSEAAAYSETPGGSIIHLARYVATDPQRWTIASAGNGHYKILNLASGLALQAGTSGGWLSLASFTSTDAQLWRLDQLTDGAYRIRNKATGLCLAAPGAAGDPNAVVDAAFAADDMHTWLITTP
jgi:arabinan endo-1,5-alpha-L-arabinosidase